MASSIIQFNSFFFLQRQTVIHWGKSSPEIEKVDLIIFCSKRPPETLVRGEGSLFLLEEEPACSLLALQMVAEERGG